jgi:hypothetical protein
MKFLSPLILVLFSLILFSCESNEYSVISPDLQTKNTSDSSNVRFDVGIDLLDLNDIIVIKTINGAEGGLITIDTVLMGTQGGNNYSSSKTTN